MAIEKVRKYFEKYGIEDRILEFDVSSATVELAAKAVVPFVNSVVNMVNMARKPAINRLNFCFIRYSS